MGEWKNKVIRGAEKVGFPIFTPYYELTDEWRRMLWEGCKYFEGINDFFKIFLLMLLKEYFFIILHGKYLS